MGFGGSVQSMITILKNNEKMRSNRSKRNALEGSYSSSKLEFPNKATKLDLIKIEEKIKREQKQTRVKQLLLLSFVLSLLITLIFIYI
ncbi:MULTISPECIES: hypothetical protein [Flavobacteriaceae]|uniref:hypothetical protein n=1 Tax=Oceanihabitans sp. 2_MG-2023 TaxID=3062661 RepID=UPI0026E18F23|nr:hypothetical protein [Oceanihabitans sp. 2_MG-2023]